MTHDERLLVLHSPPVCLSKSGLTIEATRQLGFPLDLVENGHLRKQSCSDLVVGIQLKQSNLRFSDLSHCILLSPAAYSLLFRLLLLYMLSCLS